MTNVCALPKEVSIKKVLDKVEKQIRSDAFSPEIADEAVALVTLGVTGLVDVIEAVLTADKNPTSIMLAMTVLSESMSEAAIVGVQIARAFAADKRTVN